MAVVERKLCTGTVAVYADFIDQRGRRVREFVGEVKPDRDAAKRTRRLAALRDEALRTLAARRTEVKKGVYVHPEDARAAEAEAAQAAASSAGERLGQLDDGRLIYRLKRRWHDGAAAFVFEPEELVARLAALVPPPRFHLVRYAGVLAPGARLRARVVLEPPEGNSAGALMQEAGEGKGPGKMPVPASDAAVPAPGLDGAPPRVPRARRQYPRAELMRRVFAVDVLECPRCHRPMKILAAIHPPDTAGAILECLGLPARPPPVASARRVVGLFESDTDWSRD